MNKVRDKYLIVLKGHVKNYKGKGKTLNGFK